MSKKPVPVLNLRREEIGQVDRQVASQLVQDGIAVWWNSCRSIKLLKNHARLVSAVRGTSAKPGQRAIESYAEARSAMCEGEVSEVVLITDCWAGKVVR